MYKQKVPSAQPRSLRSIAESHLTGTGNPKPEQNETASSYSDAASSAQPVETGGQASSGDKQPFGTMTGGR